MSEEEELRVWAEVDLGAIIDNTRALRRLIGKETKLLAVVKANAYGHGAVGAAKAALYAGADYLGVSTVEEGHQLRLGGVGAPILILGYVPPSEAERVVENRLSTAIFDSSLAGALSTAAGRLKTKAKVHIKVDTGMGRLGLYPDEVLGFYQYLRGLANLEIEGIFTHLATADDPDPKGVRWQLGQFSDLLAVLSASGAQIPLVHAANSAAVLAFPEALYDMVRPGLAIYGLLPGPNNLVDLKPAMSLKCRVAQVRPTPSGRGISYGWAYHTDKKTNIAVLPVGYADGFSRLLSNKAKVLIREKPYPIVGKITMDYCMVDVGDDPIQEGDEAVLIGRQGKETITAEDLAEGLGTISYEILCMIGARVPRVFINIPPDLLV
jgi:alanine racemase